MKQQFCQSCGMPLREEDHLYGTNADGSVNKEYCIYCYSDGKYTANVSMEDMIEFCIPPMVENNEGLTEDEARKMMQQFFPQLKRWKK